MDDLDGRIEAERRHLKVIGTLGVLRDAAFQRLIGPLQVLDQFRQTNFYVTLMRGSTTRMSSSLGRSIPVVSVLESAIRNRVTDSL